jgi:uncharacterized protein (TIGR02001 family)
MNPMHKSYLTAALVLGTASLAFAQADAPAPAVTFTLENNVASEYVFRGQEYGDLTYSPALSAAWNNFYAGVIGTMSENLILGDYEIDTYVGGTHALTENLTLDGGFVYYYYAGKNSFGGSDNGTVEPYLGSSLALGDITLSLYYYYDLQIDDSTYELTAAYSIPFKAARTSINLAATAGYVTGDLTENFYIVDNYIYYGLRADLPFTVRENATFTVGLAASDVNEDAINRGAELTVSANLAVTF